MRTLSKVVSAILHPIWMPLFTMVAAYTLDPFLGLYPSLFRFLLFIVLVNTIAPGVSILIMKKRGVISDLEIRNKGERIIPFLLFLFYYLLSYLLIRLKNAIVPEEILVIFFAVVLSLIIGIIVNRYTKISMHLMAMGGFCGVIAGLNVVHLLGIGHYLAMAFVLAGLLGWSRITQSLHTHKQVYLGFSVGFVIHYFLLIWKIYP